MEIKNKIREAFNSFFFAPGLHHFGLPKKGAEDNVRNYITLKIEGHVIELLVRSTACDDLECYSLHSNGNVFDHLMEPNSGRTALTPDDAKGVVNKVNHYIQMAQENEDVVIGSKVFPSSPEKGYVGVDIPLVFQRKFGLKSLSPIPPRNDSDASARKLER